MSIGEDRVRIYFNPDRNDFVDIIKVKAADLIDKCEEMRNTASPSEKSRLIALAQTAFEEGAMWAVKAATTAAVVFGLLWIGWAFPATAADLAIKAQPYTGSPYNWSGLYFGAQVGGEFSARPITGVTTGSLEFLGDPGALGPSATGFVGGAHIGLNYQTGGFVLGGELGGDLSSMSSAGAFTADTMTANAVVRKPWDAYLIGKAGLVFGPRGEFLFYGLGGGAAAELQNDVTITDIRAPGALKASSSNVHVGWTAGAGLDWGTGPIVLGFRYRYSDYGTHGASFDTGTGTFRADQSARDNQFTGRVSIKLN